MNTPQRVAHCEGNQAKCAPDCFFLALIEPSPIDRVPVLFPRWAFILSGPFQSLFCLRITLPQCFNECIDFSAGKHDIVTSIIGDLHSRSSLRL